MFSSSHNIVREKQYHRDTVDIAKAKSARTSAETMTENGLLFRAQRARVEASRQSPRGRLRRLFSGK